LKENRMNSAASGHRAVGLLITVLLLALANGVALAGQFVYEGRLDEFGQAANGRYDLRLRAFGHEQHGASLAAPITVEGVDVRDGRFRLDVELPLVNAEGVWFELAVRAAGEPDFSPIPGRAKAVAAPLIGACWSTTGDSGSNASTNFIGTTDQQPLVLRTANARSLRIEPSSSSFGSPALPITTNMIGGSHANQVTGGVRGATIAGGGVPSGTSDPDFFGEAPNRVTDHYGTVGGGYANRAGDDLGTLDNGAFATIGGGGKNVASGNSSTIGGGDSNIASGSYSIVVGGFTNSANGNFSTVGGGGENTAFGSWTTVGGGFGSTAIGAYGTVSGGLNNTARGPFSTVGGGQLNCAGGSSSWASGNRAKVRPGSDPGGSGSCAGLGPYPGGAGDQGTFVWADSQDADFISSGANQFLVRASGGMVVTGGAANDPLGNRLRVHGGTLRVDQLGAAGSLALCRNADNQLATCSSSARYKDEVADLALGLAAALRLRAVGYRWKGSGAADVGFVAEEIAAIDERLVTRNERGEVEGVKYDRLTAVLANAVQELAASASLAGEALFRLQSAHADLAAESAQLRERLAALEAERAESR
jgi:hypothetical protein